MIEFDSIDDLPPEIAALAEPLRQRAEWMGCGCVNPTITVDLALERIALEHNPLCPAWRHPAANGGMN